MRKILALWMFLSLSQNLWAGPRVISNGGDIYALQFVSFADKVLLYLQNSKVKGLDLKALAVAIDSTKVESTDKALSLDNFDKDAINYPTEKKIVVNRSRWSALVAEEKMALVLHEYLGILSIEDASYHFSKLLLADISIVNKIVPGSDSTWLLCQEDSLVINSVEHRAGAGERATDITLLKGAWVLKGKLSNQDAGPVILENKADKANFTGEISFHYNGLDNTVSAKGVLDLNATLIQIDSTLKCDLKSRR